MSAPSTPIGQMIKALTSPPPLRRTRKNINFMGSPPPLFNGGNFLGNPQDTPPQNGVNGVNGVSNAKRVLNFNI